LPWVGLRLILHTHITAITHVACLLRWDLTTFPGWPGTIIIFSPPPKQLGLQACSITSSPSIVSRISIVLDGGRFILTGSFLVCLFCACVSVSPIWWYLFEKLLARMEFLVKVGPQSRVFSASAQYYCHVLR
jgi:hypothetical protein